MIEIVDAAALATIQDLGRVGALNLGVGVAGAMDPMALAAGNILVGNEDGAAAIEIPVFPFAMRFTETTRFAVTGADCAPALDGSAVTPWFSCRAEAGQTLVLSVPGPAAGRATRAYLCVAGGIDVPVVLGSRSTQMRGAFGGYEGRALQAGDIVATAQSKGPTPSFGLVPPVFDLPLEVDGVPAVRVLPAAEYDAFTPAARQSLWTCPWKITPQSDRYGFRLAGDELKPLQPLELRSHGIVPGVIQVPHGGQPIIQMRDAQPSGGYPKIGVVVEADLWRLGQAPPGSRIRFLRCTWDEALDAAEDNRRWLARARRIAGLQGAGESAR
jgi:5-oxoprolinase (ATP-hydrolysing) subunit C